MPLSVFVLAVSRYFFSMLFLQSSVFKLVNLDEFRLIVSAYRLCPTVLVAFFSVTLPIAEMLLSALIISGRLRQLTALSTAFLFLLFAVAVSINIIRRRTDIRCGCFYDLNQTPGLHWLQVFRNVCFAVLSYVAISYQQAYASHSGSNKLSLIDKLGCGEIALTALFVYPLMLLLRQLIDQSPSLKRSHPNTSRGGN